MNDTIHDVVNTRIFSTDGTWTAKVLDLDGTVLKMREGFKTRAAARAWTDRWVLKLRGISA